MTAETVTPSPETIARAANMLRAGKLVAMPTETVYGLAANAADAEAVARIYAAKARPQFNPLIAHVADFDMAEQEGLFSAQARALVEAFWPGPLTLVVNIAPTGTVCDLARAGLDSIALRVPAHPVAQALLSAFRAPLVAPSANPSGQISPTKADHVAQDMATKVDLILDGGSSAAGIESTIIDARGDTPALLRPGTLAADEIESVWPGLLRPALNPDAPQSPGQLLRHYAPQAQLRLNVETPEADEAYLAFGARDGALNLSASGDLTEAAANLFAMLRTLDNQYERIAVAPIPQTGLGEAINDRLTRAAKPA
ncbi:MAG: L-threonylcarbamoyladenylate synthase [Pseudomonadota bacterium]